MRVDRGADKGLQPERTGLAWSRTGFVMMLVALLSVRMGMGRSSLLHLAAAALAATAALALFRTSRLRTFLNPGDEEALIRTRIRMIGATSGAVIAMAILHMAAVLRHLFG
ncbi:DUF202 domain-containing protein [Xanthobacter dioxanivorans]|uniref:DUF202 domain-containing protein n=1 Tax=Xanthobacter dioxanivorans TaxID=2528964 RepID=A0A974SIN2_9HYPH|nr:DUF202 domain-containing protein [Xanthobacter dioxanivorans]QRG06910.1 DUF202 domain-containing protein [Xanthobacter dioxanivorans]